MQVPHDEGVANHIGPESCAGIARCRRSVDRGAHRPAIEPRKSLIPGCRRVSIAEGNTDGRDIASARPIPAWSETLACAEAPCAGTGRSHASARPCAAAGPHREGEEP